LHVSACPKINARIVFSKISSSGDKEPPGFHRSSGWFGWLVRRKMDLQHLKEIIQMFCLSSLNFFWLISSRTIRNDRAWWFRIFGNRSL